MILIFKIDGEPVPKGRPKFSTRGGYVKAYTPQKTAEYEKKVADTFRDCFPDHKLIPRDVPLEVEVAIIKPIPKSFTKAQKKEAKEQKLFPTKKPDVDNYLKAIFDALNGVAWEDDAQIICASVGKFYGEEPYASVSIREKERWDYEDYE